MAVGTGRGQGTDQRAQATGDGVRRTADTDCPARLTAVCTGGGAVAPVVAAPINDAAEAMDQLKRLGELREAGALTTEEFDAKKTALTVTEGM